MQLSLRNCYTMLSFLLLGFEHNTNIWSTKDIQTYCRCRQWHWIYPYYVLVHISNRVLLLYSIFHGLPKVHKRKKKVGCFYSDAYFFLSPQVSVQILNESQPDPQQTNGLCVLQLKYSKINVDSFSCSFLPPSISISLLIMPCKRVQLSVIMGYQIELVSGKSASRINFHGKQGIQHD